MQSYFRVQAFFILLFSIDWIIFVCTYYALGSKGVSFTAMLLNSVTYELCVKCTGND